MKFLFPGLAHLLEPQRTLSESNHVDELPQRMLLPLTDVLLPQRMLLASRDVLLPQRMLLPCIDELPQRIELPHKIDEPHKIELPPRTEGPFAVKMTLPFEFSVAMGDKALPTVAGANW